MTFMEQPRAPYQPDEDRVLKPWEVGHVDFDQDEAREAYVGEKYEKFAELFDSFEDSDEFKFSFIWPPLVFGWLWFIYRQMYQEGLLFFFAGTFIQIVLPSFFPGSDLVVRLLINFALALCGGWIYYRKTENQIEKALAMYGSDPAQIIGWLRRNGGVSGLAIVAAVGGGFLRAWIHLMEM